MRPTHSPVYQRAAVARWDVARPPRSTRVAGIEMAGFRDRNPSSVEVRVFPHPVVTLILELGDDPLIVDAATGPQQREHLVAGFMHGAIRVHGENLECVQVRLSPVVAYAVLGTSPAKLDRTVVALDDLWGRDAA